MPDARLHVRRYRRALLFTMSAAIAITTFAAPSMVATASSAADPMSVKLNMRKELTTTTYGNRAYTDFGIRMTVRGAPLEIRTTRSDYDSQPVTKISANGKETTLPAGTTSSVGSLEKFIKMRFTPKSGTAFDRYLSGCPSAENRVSPDGPAVSQFPGFCSYNPYALGSVQGIPAGWKGRAADWSSSIWIKPGTYRVATSVNEPYATALGLQNSTVYSTIVVKRGGGDDDCGRYCRPTEPGGRDAQRPTANAHEPTGDGIDSAADLPPGTPTPDLRSLPAFGIRLASKGRLIQFSANVWNAGNSPLVVDGFRRPKETIMDAYQYFFDTDGNQIDYRNVGTMEWDPDPTHLHWHFTDFATYELLNADMTKSVRSGKEAFCLANTDAVDLTVDGADWATDEDDLGSVCGDSPTTPSIRESLSAGWGDTYDQFRAGQAFNIRWLKDGIYYIRVTANPDGNLIESNADNNVALRKIKVRTNKNGSRGLKVFPVGIVDEGDLTNDDYYY